MGMLGGLLTKRALLLAKVETTTGVDANPTPELNAVLVKEPTPTADPQILERDFVANDLSPFEHVVGRIVGGFEFSMDIGGNGIQQSGNLVDAPTLATLLRGCGYQAIAVSGAAAEAAIGPVPDKGNPATAPKITFAKSGTSTLESPVLYTIEVTTGGASGTAQVKITNNNTDEDDLSAAVPAAITSGTVKALGGSGVSVTPTWAGNLVVGQKWHVFVVPVGIKMKPRSTGHETLTLYMYKDGLLFKLTAAMGTFSIQATAGELATITFNFSGAWVDPVDVATPDFEQPDVLPPQVELANLTWGSNVNLTTEQFTIDGQVNVVQRPDVNSAFGYAGSRIASRAPEGGFNPEATLEADEPFWETYTSARAKFFSARIGKAVGNQCAIIAPRTQTSEIGFGDRDGIMTYEKSVAFKRWEGDDELIFHFC
ncbi:hypothetical protein EVC24_067 [Rhizobium phage RHph_I4]|nr:hypothetical protein EVC24_067 [Rhizobium phage RHph_I4]